MKNFFLNKSIEIVRKNENYSEEKLDEIRYGLEAIYITITKAIIILILSSILHITLEFVIFAILYKIIRLYAFGMHASRSLTCLMSSIIVFLGVPFLALILKINSFVTFILGTFCLIIIFIYAPADTHKRPLINAKKRKMYKVKATIVAAIYTVISILINNDLISNLLIFSLMTEGILILPITYKMFNKPYRNYESYHRTLST